jgi:predicted pyridoxine 5'-phosphate oxidase superfamily flavin-nucleotide-binding protein
MGKVRAEIDDALRAFLNAQHLFFVATAPSGDDGHVNCSPKGGEALQVLGPTTVAYVDRVGSGIETIAHLRQNGRIVVMVCAFDGAPRIVRLHGRGSVLEPNDPVFESLLSAWGTVRLGVRSVIRVEVARISDSCGFGVPLYAYEGERDTMAKWCEKKGAEGVAAYVREKNATSLDGLPGMRSSVD